ncbi:uncharacterized protein ARMOST_17955 [Armillaria ostoyae]|uniref:Uncharacterized protein n=1 Tax=Armillaria ostoyae TaxID=47428 RepID=A0A284S0F6_ARMOS|nr:uncharacterized protein ARMOST_17955 [Armillaria ostoyae]
MTVTHDTVSNSVTSNWGSDPPSSTKSQISTFMDLCLISLMNYLYDWTSSRLNALHRYNIISLVLYHYNLVGNYSQGTAGSIFLNAQISHVFDRLKDLCWGTLF